MEIRISVTVDLLFQISNDSKSGTPEVTPAFYSGPRQPWRKCMGQYHSFNACLTTANENPASDLEGRRHERARVFKSDVITKKPKLH